MSTHTYDREPGYGGMSFARAIVAAMPGKEFDVVCETGCDIIFADELTEGEISDLNGAVSGFSYLAEMKEQRVAEVDSRTLELMDLFFTTGDGTQTAVTSAGTALKSSIDSAADETALGNVTDDR